MSESAGSELDELGQVAARVDEAAAGQSHYIVAAAVREAFGLGIAGDLPDELTDLERAVIWAFDYRTEIDSQRPRRVRVLPKSDFGERTEPPALKNVPEQVRLLWRDLLGATQTPASRARFAHLLFELGSRERIKDGATAIDAYIASAAHWGRDVDGIEDLRIGACIADTIGDGARCRSCLEALLTVAEQELAADPRDVRAGLVLRPISYVLDFTECPERVDALIERAAIELDDVHSRDSALQFAFRRCTDDACRQSIWRRRVEGLIAAAADEQEPIIRLTRRREALEIAERSGNAELRRLAASELERAREEDLGLVRYGTSSHLYAEEFEQVRDSFISENSWQEALFRFAHATPLSGNVDSNRALVAAMRAENPLSALFPVELLGPDNMPILRAETEEERFDYDLVKIEAQYTGAMVLPLVDALHEIVVRFGLPSSAELTSFLASWPGMSQPAMHSVVRALQRFWSGDSEGATYTLVPRIERLIRTLILNTTGGMYRLQTTHGPGQYPGLGAMLGIRAEDFGIDESRMRFLRLTLTEPAGFNLRNTLSHGINDWMDPGAAAIAIHNALYIGTLSGPMPGSQ